MLTMNCTTDFINITRSCSVSVSSGISALGSYLEKKKSDSRFILKHFFYFIFFCIKIHYLLTSHCNISDTRGKFGYLKFSSDISLGYPKARIISVKAEINWIFHNNIK